MGEAVPAAIDCPPVSTLWTDQGALFGFSDKNDDFMAIDPATGAWQTISCAFQVTDAEGLAFFTTWTDPRYAIEEAFD